MMLVLINMVLNVKLHQYFGDIMDRLILQTFMVGFSDISNIGQVEDLQMIKEKLLDGKELWLGLKAN